MATSKYYDLEPINSMNCTYNIIVGQRSNGKTYAICNQILKHYVETGEASAYIRRLDEQIKPSNLKELFNPQPIEEITKGQYNAVIYRVHEFTLVKKNNYGEVIEKAATPFCRTYALNTADTTKGADRGVCKYILFDEFLTRNYYLKNEFVLFQQLVSSIFRNRDGGKIYMVANTVSKYSEYWEELGLKDITQQQQGTIDLYQYGEGLKLACEYCEEFEVSKENKSYYAFDNPRLKMITSGTWEIDSYPHAPPKLTEKEPILIFFIKHSNRIIQGNLYCYGNNPFIFLHKYTKEIPEPDNKIIYTAEYDTNILHVPTLKNTPTDAHKWINTLFTHEKIFYSTNEVGELVRSWRMSCNKKRSAM